MIDNSTNINWPSFILRINLNLSRYSYYHIQSWHFGWLVARYYRSGMASRTCSDAGARAARLYSRRVFSMSHDLFLFCFFFFCVIKIYTCKWRSSHSLFSVDWLRQNPAKGDTTLGFPLATGNCQSSTTKLKNIKQDTHFFFMESQPHFCCPSSLYL